MRLKMLDSEQAIRVIKGAVKNYIRGHGPVAEDSIGSLPRTIFGVISGAMLQMAQEETPVDHIQAVELKELKEKWEKNKNTIQYWRMRANNAEVELTKHGLDVPEPPKMDCATDKSDCARSLAAWMNGGQLPEFDHDKVKNEG
jgi:hypothetical protein